MHGIYALEEMLCDELEKIGEREELSATALDTADKLSHSLKNVQKIIEYYEAMGDSDYPSGNSYARDGYGDRLWGGYGNGRSYARGRDASPKRDSRGRYSRNYSRAEATDEMMGDLHDMMNNAPNEQFRQKVESLIKEIQLAR